jgi:trans-aconitate methyltransferase
MPAMAVDWPAYYAATLRKPLHPMYANLEPHLPPPGLAYELGCGVGHGVLWLLSRGWRVRAVDSQPEAIEILRSRLPEGARCEVAVARLQDLYFEPCRLVVAGFSLFFLPPEEFGACWARLADAIEPGGAFMGQFLGVRDAWSGRGYSQHDAAQVRTLLGPFETLYYEEAERDGETATGEGKHWHVFHVLARKR